MLETSVVEIEKFWRRVLYRSVVETCRREVLETSVGEERWRRELRFVGEECRREKCGEEVLEKRVERSVAEKCWRRVWTKECCGERSVGEKCPPGKWLQRFAVVVELTLRWKRCWMRCALKPTSFGVKNMQRIQSRSTCLICIRVRGLLRFFQNIDIFFDVFKYTYIDILNVVNIIYKLFLLQLLFNVYKIKIYI